MQASLIITPWSCGKRTSKCFTIQYYVIILYFVVYFLYFSIFYFQLRARSVRTRSPTSWDKLVSICLVFLNVLQVCWDLMHFPTLAEWRMLCGIFCWCTAMEDFNVSFFVKLTLHGIFWMCAKGFNWLLNWLALRTLSPFSFCIWQYWLQGNKLTNLSFSVFGVILC